MSCSRRQLLLAAAGILIALCGYAAEYPSKPIRLVVGYPPGGANDLVGRHVAGSLSTLLHSPVVVAAMGVEPMVSSSPQALAKFINAEFARWERVVKSASIQSE